MAITLAVMNQKGGVGKTTTAIQFASAIALSGRRTLLIDLDSQANATRTLGVHEGDQDRPGAYAAINAPELVNASWAQRSEVSGLLVLGASLELAGLDLELSDTDDRLDRLSRATGRLQDSFDWIVLDCPPSLGLASVNALVAADAILIPVPPEQFALDGLERLNGTIARLRQAGGRTIADPMMLITMAQRWVPQKLDRAAQFRQDHGDAVLVAEVPYSNAIDEAMELRRPVFMQREGSEAADAYLHAAAELILRQETGVMPELKAIAGLVKDIQSGLKDASRTGRIEPVQLPDRRGRPRVQTGPDTGPKVYRGTGRQVKQAIGITVLVLGAVFGTLAILSSI